MGIQTATDVLAGIFFPVLPCVVFSLVSSSFFCMSCVIPLLCFLLYLLSLPFLCLRPSVFTLFSPLSPVFLLLSPFWTVLSFFSTLFPVVSLLSFLSSSLVFLVNLVSFPFSLHSHFYLVFSFISCLFCLSSLFSQFSSLFQLLSLLSCLSSLVLSVISCLSCQSCLFSLLSSLSFLSCLFFHLLSFLSLFSLLTILFSLPTFISFVLSFVSCLVFRLLSLLLCFVLPLIWSVLLALNPYAIPFHNRYPNTYPNPHICRGCTFARTYTGTLCSRAVTFPWCGVVLSVLFCLAMYFLVFSCRVSFSFAAFSAMFSYPFSLFSLVSLLCFFRTLSCSLLLALNPYPIPYRNRVSYTYPNTHICRGCTFARTSFPFAGTYPCCAIV